MKKIIFALLILGALSGCQMDDIKNSYSISGRIMWNASIPFSDQVTVTLFKGDQIVAISTENEFSFTNLEEGEVYTVYPYSEADGRNGLSTLDIVSVEKYVSGENTFDLYQKIAADVNKDNQINLIDRDIMKNCIISSPKIYECPGYRFVSQEHDDTNFRFIDKYTSVKLYADQDVTFMAIKLGDINGTIHP